jgi:hypothetical protein
MRMGGNASGKKLPDFLSSREKMSYNSFLNRNKPKGAKDENLGDGIVEHVLRLDQGGYVKFSVYMGNGADKEWTLGRPIDPKNAVDAMALSIWLSKTLPIGVKAKAADFVRPIERAVLQLTTGNKLVAKNEDGRFTIEAE